MLDLPHFARVRHEPGKKAAWVLAVAVHALLAAFLIYGIRWQSTAPQAVQVELVSRVATPAVRRAEPRPAPVQKPEPKVEPRPTPRAPSKPDLALPEKPKPKPKESAPVEPDTLKEALRHEWEKLNLRRKVEADARQLAQIQADAQAAARNKGMADYMARIGGKIRGNIVLPPEIAGNPEAKFSVAQLPGGQILAVKLERSSGNAALDGAIERAILKSSPLPKPDNPAWFERNLVIQYRPFED